jgi:hypothetical protein
MLVKEIKTSKTEKEANFVEKMSVYLCYDWKSKTEFVLVKCVLEETFSSYSPQYGRDDNYNQHTRGDYQFLAFSVEAFKREKPDLAICLNAL